jgi:hypothetical protein
MAARSAFRVSRHPDGRYAMPGLRRVSAHRWFFPRVVLRLRRTLRQAGQDVMTRGRNSDWLHLAGGYVVQFSPARTRKGTRFAPRFIVLQPQASPRAFRATLCAGYVEQATVTLDYGVATETLCAAILERFQTWKRTPP